MVCVSSSVRRRVAAMALVGATLVPIPCAALFDAFLDVPGIPGESTAPIAGQIDVISFGSTVESAQSKASSLGCAAKEGKIANSIFVTKQIDKASPKLYLAAAQGTNFPTVTLRVFRADPMGTLVNYLTITLSNAVVSHINGGGAESDADNPHETVTFAYAAIQYDYAKPGGGPADASSAVWTTNCKPSP